MAGEQEPSTSSSNPDKIPDKIDTSESHGNDETNAADSGRDKSGDALGQPGAPPPTNKISKNQLKRQRKWAQAMAVKKRRKEQEKAIKHAKAQVQGRDIDSERVVMEENRTIGAGWAKRDEKWKQMFARNSSKFQICVDCSFEDQMTEREINSLGSQLRFCYSYNKQAKHPIQAKFTSLSGATLKYLQNVSGFESWANRAFEHTSQDLVDAFPDKSKHVYLTSDSENVVDKLEDGKVYIIGGIVDRNRLKRVAINRAEELGITTARLPIAEHFDLVATKVLTVNHVFEILLRLREHENDWKKTLLSVLPERKDAKERNVEKTVEALTELQS